MSSRKTPSRSASSATPPRAIDRIRAVADDMFYREGIRAIGVDEIVTRAGVTKPSLYRSFASKDELAAAYLRDYEAAFWERFDAAAKGHEHDPRAHLLAYFEGLAQRASKGGYRGCGLTNAAVEYPQAEHPARKVAEANKRALRSRLAAMAKDMGAADAQALGDGLLLLLEGAYASGQLFGKGGPVRSLVENAQRLIDASVSPARVRKKTSDADRRG
ncbi:TetR/AcrR family transcriptional regulator [Dokdonella sp.]|uniref:TetR/AcrR family transcriptional regulator n=1 Tax=Dokdonella sp. TaxID=2291710 RepID=UPI0025C43199|nr:TetR/AcrR family transcriptional regulator [Dokdonella sp.]